MSVSNSGRKVAKREKAPTRSLENKCVKIHVEPELFREMWSTEA